MKFGKRLAAEASRAGRGWSSFYLDYKAIKKAIKDDIECKNSLGTSFQGSLVAELNKVSHFYSDKAAQLEAMLGALPEDTAAYSAERLLQLRVDVQELIKFVALNYLAVIKAIKKRNRHLQERFGNTVSTSLDALDLLGHEVFFTSPRLAALATQAEILSTVALVVGTAASGVDNAAGAAPAAGGSGGLLRLASGPAAISQQLLEEFQCPICLETLHNPVLLTCAHRFCWGCLVAHCTASRNNRLPLMQSVKEKGGVCSHPSSPSFRMLEEIANSEEDSQSFYTCPVCRKPQVLDIESLVVDVNLSNFIDGLDAVSRISISSAGAPWGILPPQPRQHRGKLTVLLDLDGTLVTSFTPRRAPRLPPYVRTHVVGVGSKLNPQGVFVVERPGLLEFLQQLAEFAEVVVFTAGLEDYAKPIVDAIDPTGRLFTARIYRDGCLKTDHYQCVKDMARVNRSLLRTVLVDDTPLAFLHQPDNGVPVLGFRGDPDDRLLLEAVLPLLQVLDIEADVRPVLQRRFDMSTWFKRHGFPVDQVVEASLQASQVERDVALQHRLAFGLAPTPEQISKFLASGTPMGKDGTAVVVPGVEETAEAAKAAAAPSPASRRTPPTSSQNAVSTHESAAGAPTPQIVSAVPKTEWLLLTGVDWTLVDFNVGERLVEQLAPELLPMLVGLDPAESNVPIMNTILAELQRRGVSRDALVSTLNQLGASELPAAAAEMLRVCSGACSASPSPAAACPGPASPAADVASSAVRVLSGGNSVFVSHLLAGARVGGYVDEVVTHPASFERVGDAPDASCAVQPMMGSVALGGQKPVDQQGVLLQAVSQPGCSGSPARKGSVGQKLVVRPHSSEGSGSRCCAFSCATCPGGLCKGREIQAMRHKREFNRVALCGAGAGDICAALALGPLDCVFARRGYPLADYIDKAAGAAAPLEAKVFFWHRHEELRDMMQDVMAGRSCA